MRVFVRAKPRSKRERIVMINDTHFSIEVTEPPVEDRANKAIMRMLARHFNVAPSNIRILSGRSSKQKVFDIPIEEGSGHEPSGRR